MKYMLVVAAAISLIAHAANAQQTVLEEVVVTAQKRTESLQDIPVAVSAISGKDLIDAGFRDIGDLSALVPSLIVMTTAAPQYTSFRTRRIGSEGDIPTFEPDTALYIDGAFRSRSALAMGDLVDVKSVEVLKGPQGTLYGKNAGAGVISITSNAPSDTFESMIELSAGSEGYQAAKATLNMPLSDRFATRLSFSGTHRDSLFKNLVDKDFDNLDGKALRVQFRYDMSDTLSTRLILGRSVRDMNPMLGDDYKSPSQVNIVESAGGQVTNNIPDDRIVEHNGRPFYDQTADDAVLLVDYQGNGYTFSSITGAEEYNLNYRMGNAEQMSLSILNFDDRQIGKSFSQEFRIASSEDSDLSWLFGFFYFKNEFYRGDQGRPEFTLEEDIEEYGAAVAAALISAGLPLPAPLPILGAEGDTGNFYATQDNRSIGVFTHENLQLTENLELTLGLRYSREEKSGTLTQSNETSTGDCGPLGTNLVCLITPEGNNFDDSDSWSAFTGSLSLSYSLADVGLLYATYSTGFKAGGYSLEFGEATTNIRPFDETKIQNFELGWKTEFWRNRARLNAALFHTEYSDFQNASFVALATVVSNAEKVVVDGIEIDSTWLLSENFRATINLAYIEAIYETYSAGQCYYGRTPDNALLQCDLSDETLPNAPKLTGNIALYWEQPLFNGDLYARLDTRYTSAANYSGDLDPRHEDGAYTVSNFRAGWRNEHFDIVAWIKNISDQLYFIQKAPSVATAVDEVVGSPVGSFQAYFGDPRTYGVTIRWFF